MSDAPGRYDGPLELAGLLPPASEGRAYARRRRCPSGCDAFGVLPSCATCDADGVRTDLLPHPARIADAVAVASDPCGVATAEALARECCARLAPWGCPTPERVVWRVVDAFAQRFCVRAEVTLAQRLTRCDEYGEIKHTPERVVTPFVGEPQWSAGRHALLADTWDQLAATDARVGLGADDHPRAWERVAALANPYHPLVALWATGYALDAITHDAITLVCPAVGASP